MVERFRNNSVVLLMVLLVSRVGGRGSWRRSLLRCQPPGMSRADGGGGSCEWLVPATSIYAARLSGELLTQNLLDARAPRHSPAGPAAHRAVAAAAVLGQAYSGSAHSWGARALASELQQLAQLEAPDREAAVGRWMETAAAAAAAAQDEEGREAGAAATRARPADWRAEGGWREEVLRTERIIGRAAAAQAGDAAAGNPGGLAKQEPVDALGVPDVDGVELERQRNAAEPMPPRREGRSSTLGRSRTSSRRSGRSSREGSQENSCSSESTKSASQRRCETRRRSNNRAGAASRPAREAAAAAAAGRPSMGELAELFGSPRVAARRSLAHRVAAKRLPSCAGSTLRSTRLSGGENGGEDGVGDVEDNVR